MQQTSHYYVFLVDGEVARVAPGLLLEADGFAGKLDKGVAALVMDGVTDMADSIGIIRVRSLGIEAALRLACQVMVEGTWSVRHSWYEDWCGQRSAHGVSHHLLW